MCWLGRTREPSSATTRPSTRTQPSAIHSSASRREAMPSSLMRFDRRRLPSSCDVEDERDGGLDDERGTFGGRDGAGAAGAGGASLLRVRRGAGTRDGGFI